MKCIGRACNYNKCNCGDYCNLPNSFFTCAGRECVIQERIDELEEEIFDKQKVLHNLKIQKALIQSYADLQDE